MANGELFPARRASPLPGGYMGRILRVDLTTGKFTDENLPEEPVLRKFIGGQALALYILLKELSRDATPYGPENKVVMMTGPITGTGFTPGGTKVTAVYLRPPTQPRARPGGVEGLLAGLSESGGLRRPDHPGRVAAPGLSIY